MVTRATNVHGCTAMTEEKERGAWKRKKKMKRERERVVSIRKTLFTIERP